MSTDSPVSGSGFEVYPDALRDASKAVAGAAERVATFAGRDLTPMVLHENDVGLLGENSGIVQAFNVVIKNFKDKSERGASRLAGLTESLAKAAAYYETQDEDSYRQILKQEREGN